MGNKIRFSPASRRDMDEIWDYIARELQNPAAAAKTVDAIMKAAKRLTTFAQMGAPLSPIIGMPSDYRFLSSGNYLLFYRAQGDQVYIDRVIYGRRDYLRILGVDTPDE